MKCLLWTALVTFVGVASAHAFTCDDVRALNTEQKAFYIKVYNITPAQQDRIRHICYGLRAHRIIAISDERSTGGVRHGE